MSFEEEMQYRIEDAEEIISRYLPSEEGLQKTVAEASNYSILAGGKRLRPILMKETFRLFDGKGKSVEPFMMGIECIHTASLIHDDLPCMDNDEFRRGKRSTWAAYGYDMAVLAGDALFIYAFEAAAKSFLLTDDPKKAGVAMEILASKAGFSGMIGGQTVDVEMTGKPLSEDQLSFIYELKTAALIEASMMIGAVLAGASREDIEAVEQIAGKIGVAFQIQDDILDVISSDEALGKPVHSDEKNEKTTYVTLYGLEAAQEKVRSLTDEAVSLMHTLAGENVFLEKLLVSLVTREK